MKDTMKRTDKSLSKEAATASNNAKQPSQTKIISLEIDESQNHNSKGVFVQGTLGGPTPFLPTEKMCVFPFLPMGKMGKHTFFHGQIWGWTPPPGHSTNIYR